MKHFCRAKSRFWLDSTAIGAVPARMLSPLVKEIAEERRETLSVAKLNVDELPEVANRHGIVAIPALLLFKNGEMEEKLVGYREKEDLDDFLDEHL